MAVSAYQAPERAFAAVFGVDFSGARLAGRTTWIARLDPAGATGSDPAFALGSLRRLDRLAGTAERRPALTHLVWLVTQSRDALWAFDFPFGLPVELFPARSRWPRQFELVREYATDDYGLGLECLRRARELGRMHIRRQTDVDARAPFDPYHYRIIYQTFYGMHDVLAPLRLDLRTAVLPFQYDRLATADRVLVEACPASTLKRLGLPHQNYKQPAGGPLTHQRRRTRRVIVDEIASLVRLDDRDRRVMMRDPGGDAIDAVLAALGAAHAFATVDHSAIARHARYPREGHLFF